MHVKSAQNVKHTHIHAHTHTHAHAHTRTHTYIRATTHNPTNLCMSEGGQVLRDKQHVSWIHLRGKDGADVVFRVQNVREGGAELKAHVPVYSPGEERSGVGVGGYP